MFVHLLQTQRFLFYVCNCPRRIVTSKGLMTAKQDLSFLDSLPNPTNVHSTAKNHETKRGNINSSGPSSHLISGRHQKTAVENKSDRKQQPPTKTSVTKSKDSKRENGNRKLAHQSCVQATQCNATHLRVFLIDTDTNSSPQNEEKKKEEEEGTCKNTSKKVKPRKENETIRRSEQNPRSQI